MANDNCFLSSSVLENPFHLQSEQRKNDFILYTKNIFLWSSCCTIRNGSRKLLNSKIELFLTTVRTESPKPFSQRYPFLVWQSSLICLWLLLTYKNYSIPYDKVERNIFHKILC